MLVEYCPACAAVLGGPVICCGFGRLTQERDEQRRIKDEAFDRLAQVIRERDEALAALKKVRAVIWNWGGPANRNEAGEWVVMKQFETAMVDAIAAVLDAPRPQEESPHEA